MEELSDCLRTETKAAEAPPPVRAGAGLLQRKCACGGVGASGVTGDCSDCERKRLSRKTRHAAHSSPTRARRQPPEIDTPPPIVEQVLNSSSGQPLDPATRVLMESRLGHDFSRVRVYTDARAAASAEAVNALAYTVGQQVVFGAGQYQPNTQAGRRLLAHELAHAAQQGEGGRGFQGKLEIGPPDSADEREADRAAEAIESPVGIRPNLSRSHIGPPVLRRKTGGAGSWVRGLFSSLLFGTFWFPDSWLQEYLNKLDETGDIEGDPDSDDKAREIVNTWRKGGSEFVLTARRKALLIHEMLDGPTLWGDEDAILEILERSYNYELSYIFGPEGGVTAQRLGEDIPDDIGDRLREFYLRRFDGARDAVLAGEIKPIGKPVELGFELPPVGVTEYKIETFGEKTPTGWNPECVMGILCQQDSSIIKQLPSLDVKMMDNIEVKLWTFDGNSWSYKVAYPSGVNKPDKKLVGVVKRATCNYAAQTMFHEVHHQNQHADVRETVFTMEVDAYTETEKWAIERGLPEELSDIHKSLRKTNKQGQEIPNIEAIEAKVTSIYGGPTPAPGEQETGGEGEGDKNKEVVGQVKSHEEPKTTKVKVPGKDELVPRPSKKGDTYLEEPPTITNPQPIPREVWKCPKEKKPKDDEAVTLQRSAKSSEMPDTVPPVVHEVLNSPGQPLDADTRELMGSRFGYDFSRVRVHADAKAAESAKAVNALAYTVKHHVAFDAGRYSPDTRDGRRLLAHELAHVVQQSRGASAPLSLSRDSYLERAADQAASALAQGEGRIRVTGMSAPAIARQPAAPRKKAKIISVDEIKADKKRKEKHQYVGGPSVARVCGSKDVDPTKGNCKVELKTGAEVTIISGQPGEGWLEIENAGFFEKPSKDQKAYILGVFAKEVPVAAPKPKPPAAAAPQPAAQPAEETLQERVRKRMNNLPPKVKWTPRKGHPTKGHTVLAINLVITAKDFFHNEPIDREAALTTLQNVKRNFSDVYLTDSNFDKKFVGLSFATRDNFGKLLRLGRSGLNLIITKINSGQLTSGNDATWTTHQSEFIAAQDVMEVLAGDLDIKDAEGVQKVEAMASFKAPKAFVDGLMTGLQAHLPDEDYQKLAKKLGIANLVPFLSMPVFTAGATVGIAKDIYDALKGLYDLVTNAEEMIGQMLALITKLLVDEEAARAIGQQLGEQKSKEIHALINEDIATFTYKLGVLIGPTIVYAVLWLTGLGELMTAAAVERMALVLKRFPKVIAAAEKIGEGLAKVKAALPKRKAAKVAGEAVEAAEEAGQVAKGAGKAVKEAEGAGKVVKEAEETGKVAKGAAEAAEDTGKTAKGASKVVAEHTANGHEYRVLADGSVVRCSNRCAKLRKRLQSLEHGPAKDKRKMKALEKKLDEIDAISDPKEKAKKAAEFDKQFTANHGPGEWMDDFSVQNMSKEAAAYQSRVTGAKAGKGYYLNNVQFDGFEPGKLIDAKLYTNDGRFMRDKWYQFNKAWDILDDAKRQVKAAGGMPIEWRVAGSNPAALIQQLFKTHGIPITVVHVP